MQYFLLLTWNIYQNIIIFVLEDLIFHSQVEIFYLQKMISYSLLTVHSTILNLLFQITFDLVMKLLYLIHTQIKIEVFQVQSWDFLFIFLCIHPFSGTRSSFYLIIFGDFSTSSDKVQLTCLAMVVQLQLLDPYHLQLNLDFILLIIHLFF